MARRHSDGKPCRCRPVGRCVPCGAGKHDQCNDAISVLGCACPCNDE